jgi:hypothetical protein
MKGVIALKPVAIWTQKLNEFCNFGKNRSKRGRIGHGDRRSAPAFHVCAGTDMQKPRSRTLVSRNKFVKLIENEPAWQDITGENA